MLPFSTNLRKAHLEKRYKRFLTDAVLDDGTKITAHCPNTGSMATCMSPGCTIWLTKNDDPNRKLKYTWELTETIGGYIGVNTARPNAIVADGVEHGKIPELDGYGKLQREVKYGKNSRIDLLLSDGGKKPNCYVEVKNTTLVDGDSVQFPDAVTERGQKHLKELADVVAAGHRGVIFFLVNRPDGVFFYPADNIDPEYGRLLRKVAKAGVEILAYRANHTMEGSQIGPKIPIKLD